MPACPSCGYNAPSGARFCRECGAALPPPSLKERDLRNAPRDPDWIGLDDVIYTRDKRFGGIGALLAFFGSFAPWSSASLSLWGWQVGSFGMHSPQAWLTAMIALAAAVFLFRQRSGSVVLVAGIVLAGWAVLFALTSLTGSNSPSWGVLLTAAGGGLLAYSGHLTNQYERAR